MNSVYVLIRFSNAFLQSNFVLFIKLENNIFLFYVKEVHGLITLTNKVLDFTIFSFTEFLFFSKWQSVNQGRIQEFVQEGGLKFVFFSGGAEQPLGPEIWSRGG